MVRTMKTGKVISAIAVVLGASACQTEDLPPLPAYVSSGHDNRAVVARSVTSNGSVVASKYSQDHRYFVEFRSRYALSYGHTYVVFGTASPGGGVAKMEVAGLHPASESEAPYVLGHFVPVPAETGWSDGDLEEKYRSASWRVMLDEAEYRKVTAYIRKLQASSPVWQASVYNCNAFAGDVARSMGYKVPSKYLRPQQFITKLRELNTT